MSKKLEIDIDYYPSDFDLWSVIMTQGISRKNLASVLRAKGIFCSSKHVAALANVYCSMIHDDKHIQELLQYSNVRENRTQASKSELEIKDTNMDELALALRGTLYNPESPDSKVRLGKNICNPSYNKVTKEIEIKQTFTKIDFSKTKLLQEITHEFTLTVKPKEVGSGFEFHLQTSSVEGEQYVEQIKDKIKAVFAEKGVKFSEISLLDIQEDKINSFFDQIIRTKIPGYQFVTTEQVKLQNPKFQKKKADVDEESTDADNENGIKTLTISGEYLLENEDIKKWRKEGYYIRSVKSEYSEKDTSESSNFYAIRFEFNRYNRFHCEVVKSWSVTNDGAENIKSIDNWTRKSLQDSVNDIALKAFEKFKKPLPDKS